MHSLNSIETDSMHAFRQTLPLWEGAGLARLIPMHFTASLNLDFSCENKINVYYYCSPFSTNVYSLFLNLATATIQSDPQNFERGRYCCCGNIHNHTHHNYILLWGVARLKFWWGGWAFLVGNFTTHTPINRILICISNNFICGSMEYFLLIFGKVSDRTL